MNIVVCGFLFYIMFGLVKFSLSNMLCKLVMIIGVLLMIKIFNLVKVGIVIIFGIILML